MSAKVVRPRADVASSAPTTSNWCDASSSRLSGTATWATQTVAMPSGTLSRKAQRHDAYSTSQPPTKGPMAAATPPRPDQAPMAVARSSRRKLAWMRARLPGVSSAPPTPWSTRAAMSCPGVWASPQATDAAVNHTTPMTKTRRRP